MLTYKYVGMQEKFVWKHILRKFWILFVRVDAQFLKANGNRAHHVFICSKFHIKIVLLFKKRQISIKISLFIFRLFVKPKHFFLCGRKKWCGR